MSTAPSGIDLTRRLAPSRLRDARRALDDAEAHLDEVILGLVAGATRLSHVGAADEAVLREARERAFAGRRRLDEIRLELLAPEAPALTPNDEDDLATALHAKLRANEEAAARADAIPFTRLTPACVGVATAW
ncbi:hypothetical protein [Methylobacterium sp. JK268]